MSQKAPLVEAIDLRVGHAGVALLPPLGLQVRPGELWALIGRNGGGKSTLLRTLLGLLPPVAGLVRRAPELRIGWVPQRTDVDPSVPSRVRDLVRLGTDVGLSFLDPFGPRRRAAEIARALHDADAEEIADSPFAALSEGQKQRALLARALASDPSLLVLDEPTSAMDLAAERAVFALLGKLCEARALGLVVVGHHLPVLLARATHVALVDRDAQLAIAGPLEEIARTPAFAERYAALVLDDGGAVA